jgi:hypothetical protein
MHKLVEPLAADFAVKIFGTNFSYLITRDSEASFTIGTSQGC